MYWKTRNKGFTLVELLVVIAIIATLSVAGIASFVSYSNIQSLNTAASDVVSILQLAKSRSMSQVKPSHVNCNSYTLEGYQVVLNAPLDASHNYEISFKCSGGSSVGVSPAVTLPSGISFNLSGNTSLTLLFKVLTGELEGAANTGTEIILSNGNITKTITVFNDGRIISN